MILDEIVKYKHEYIESLKRHSSNDRDDRSNPSCGNKTRRSLVSAIKDQLQNQVDRAAIIAEVKRRSPSGGDMGLTMSFEDIIKSYEEAGAVGLSILTDERYFGGDIKDLHLAREISSLPILRKDFIIDEYQIVEAATMGADVILLIASILDDVQLESFIDLAHTFELEVLLEVHTDAELIRSLKTAADIIGINNRNLDTLVTNITTTIELLPSVQDGRIIISESGIRTSADVKKLSDAGAHAFLIGEALLKEINPSQKLAELMDMTIYE